MVRESVESVGKEKVYGGNDLLKSQVLSSEWKTERVREDASGDREDGEEDDELPCVIGESEGDCVWRVISNDYLSKYTLFIYFYKWKYIVWVMLQYIPG